tara:strand:- start:2311 stop:2850 length:540 start_codon:yes stop_codon:yes gene_type:complete
MERCRPIKYKPDWTNINIRELLKLYVKPNRLSPEDLRASNPWANEEDLEKWIDERKDHEAKYRQARFHPGKVPCPELAKMNKVLGYGKADSINILFVPKDTPIAEHRDIVRKVGINFVMEQAAPIVVQDKSFNYDRFVLDTSVRHMVPAAPVDRVTLQVAFWKHDFDEVCTWLEKDGWL